MTSFASSLVTVVFAVIATYVIVLATHEVAVEESNAIADFVLKLLGKSAGGNSAAPASAPQAATGLCDQTCTTTQFPPVKHTYDPVNSGGNTATKVSGLPGWTGPLPTPMYSGYVNITNSPVGKYPGVNEMFMHYTMYEAMDGQEGLETTPILLFVSGGPGAPGLDAMFMEMGPLLLSDESFATPRYTATQVPQLLYNEYTWAKLGTLIALEAPAGVGFSYCNPQTSPKLEQCGVWNDTRSGLAHIEALRVLLTQSFPTLLGNRPLYIIGESYAGVFISSMADYMVNMPIYWPLRRNFAGTALGDACMGTNQICNQIGPFTPWSPYPGPYYWLLFQYGHGQVSNADWDLLNSQCTVDELKNNYTVNCQDTLTKIRAKIGRFWIYDVYDNCGYVGETRTVSMTNPDTFPANIGAVRNLYFRQGYSCFFTSTSVFSQWINRTDVRGALGVSTTMYYASDDGDDPSWYVSPGNLQDGFQYWDPVNGALNQIPGMLYQPRLMSYNGDTDPAINVFFTQDKWLEFSRNYSIPQTKSWYPWLRTAYPPFGLSPVGGHMIRFQNDLLTYATIRGSGHMVPTFKPETSFNLISAWLNDKLDSLPQAPADPYS